MTYWYNVVRVAMQYKYGAMHLSNEFMIRESLLDQGTEQSA